MFFNSLDFALFLPIVFFLYWFVANKSIVSQNILLLVASYFFYACWDWRFLFLLVFSTLLDFFSALKIDGSNSERSRKFWFWLSIVVNLGFLGIFKYYNFFATSFVSSLSWFGIKTQLSTLNIILPVGISFYTFHGLSYVIDIYNKRIKAEPDFFNYGLFVSFFPLLVAGPIERATHLLPQIKKKRKFIYSDAVNGLRQILWGLFKKVVIADQCAEYANLIFNNSSDYNGSTLLIGALLFAFQIYGDFSGYSDIALGTARLFGIELLRNFAFPYFSRDIAEFWRRWHISLSSWFRDYVYVPLGGSRATMLVRIRNTFLIFIISGFWHGANWTFIAWGFLNALYITPLILFNKNRNNLSIVAQQKLLPSLREFGSIVLTFSLTVLAWIFFRANNIGHAFSIVSKIFSKSLLAIPQIIPAKLIPVLMLIAGFIIIEWLGRRHQYALEHFNPKIPKSIRYVFYYLVMLSIMWFAGKNQQFIYFQF